MAKPAEKEPELEEESKSGASNEEGGEGSGDAAADGQDDKKKSKKKIVIIGVGAIVFLLAGGAAAYFMGAFKKSDEHVAVEMGADGKPIEKSVFYTLPEFLVNLNSGGKQAIFLKTTVILEIAHPGDVSQIEANLPRLLDTMNTYLRELRPSDLAGSAGLQRLREELLLRGNKVLAPVKINDVLFKDIIVQ